MSNETPPDSSKALEDIRREVIEARNMTIKTDNALKSLHAELKAVSQQQEQFQKRSWLASATAYLGFLGLCIAGVVALSTARASSAQADKERLEKQVQELAGQLEAKQADASAAATAERAAGDVYRMMTGLPGEERLKGIDALAKLDQARLSPFGRQVLTDRAALLRREVGAGILDKGKAAFRKQDWPETIDQLTRFLGMAPQPDDAVEASYYLGNALLQVRKFEDAIRHLSHFVDADKRAKNREFALVLLVQAHDALGQREKANEVAREGLNAYPNGEFRGVFFQRTQRRPEQQPAAAVPGVPPAGAAPQAAQPPATPAAAPGPTKPQASPATAPAPTR